MTNFQVWGSDTEPKPVVDMKHVSDNHILIYSFVRTIYPKKFFFFKEEVIVYYHGILCSLQVLFLSIRFSMYCFSSNFHHSNSAVDGAV